MIAVTGQVFPSLEATAPGFACHQLTNELYERKLINIRLSPTEQYRKVFAYFIPYGSRNLLSFTRWNTEDFCSTHLKTNVRSCRDFHDEMA